MSFVLLERALRRQGEDVAARAAADPGLAAAKERCAECTAAAECRAWLWSGARDGYQYFCPGAAFIDRMKR